MQWLFGATVLLNATLLFWVQPMFGKLLLPVLGGAPTVWTTCVVFFQAALLAGYGYAHLLVNRLSARWQALVHFGVVLLGASGLPPSLPESAAAHLAASDAPVRSLLAVLGGQLGLPFFALAAQGPMLQCWLARAGGPESRPPYWLYAIGNAGSLMALLSYPLWVEPHFRLTEQSSLWAAGYGLVGALVLGCVWWRVRGPAASDAKAALPASPCGPGRLVSGAGWRQQAHWLLLAFAPASLMLSVTTYLSEEIAPAPLLWVVPLGVYLTTLVAAFSRRAAGPASWASRALPIGTLAMVFLVSTETTSPIGWVGAAHLLFLLLGGLYAHGKLAAQRPAAADPTGFYFWVALGGLLGGLFNTIVAPRVFSSVLEYPLAIVLLSALRLAPRTSAPAPWRVEFRRAILWAGAVGLAVAVLGHAMLLPEAWPPAARQAVGLGLPLALAASQVRRPLTFALAVAAAFLGGATVPESHGRTLHAERSFFGVLRVTLDPTETSRRLLHGNTVHGQQFLAAERRNEPLAYYHRRGPAGAVFRQFHALATAPRVGLVGLGAGALLSYARAGEAWTVFEINPSLARLAANTNYFSYLRECAAGRVELRLGDARRRLREAPAGAYGLLVFDAFNGDAIPVHLLTREALELYLAKLAPEGLLAFHISSRSLDLRPVLGDLAAAAGLVCLARNDASASLVEVQSGKAPAQWLVMARPSAVLRRLREDRRWQPVGFRGGGRVWTDDWSDVLSALRTKAR